MRVVCGADKARVADVLPSESESQSESTSHNGGIQPGPATGPTDGTIFKILCNDKREDATRDPTAGCVGRRGEFGAKMRIDGPDGCRWLAVVSREKRSRERWCASLCLPCECCLPGSAKLGQWAREEAVSAAAPCSAAVSAAHENTRRDGTRFGAHCLPQF